MGKSNKGVGDPFRSPQISDLNTEKDFGITLKILEHIYDILPPGNDLEFLSRHISYILELSKEQLKVYWKDGKFYPSGEELLDRELIQVAMQSLINHPSTNKDLSNALSHYNRQENGADVIHNCYKAIERLAQELLGNKKVLANNKSAFLSRLCLSSPWSTILAKYIDFENDYGKHTGSEYRYQISWNEVEAFLYLTCLIIRLAVNKSSTPRNN